MTRLRAIRHVAADPSGVALLLAEPAPWAGHGCYWTVDAPQRAGAGFTADIRVTDPSGRSTTGVSTVTPSPGSGCEVRLDLVVRNRAAARRLKTSADGFLGWLAERAQARSFAA
jgi:hypothetical protein